MRYVVKGLYTMVVEADNGPEAKQVSERILRHEGITGAFRVTGARRFNDEAGSL